VLISRLSWYVAASADVFVAGRLLGQAAVGAYSFAGSLASLPQEKITALLSRVMPAFYSTVQHDMAAMRRYLLIMTEGVAIIAFPVALGMSLVAPDFVLLVLGEKWRPVIAPLQILAVWGALRSVFSLVPPLLYVTGGSRLAMLNGLLCAATYPPAFWIGSHWGVIGLAVSWVFVQPPSWIAPYWHVLQTTQLSLRQYARSLWPALSGVLVMGTAVLGIRQNMPGEWPLVARLLCEAGGGAMTYAAAIVVLHRARVRVFIDFIKSRGTQSV
jgi:PST family polysaccharide transporter